MTTNPVHSPGALWASSNIVRRSLASSKNNRASCFLVVRWTIGCLQWTKTIVYRRWIIIRPCYVSLHWENSSCWQQNVSLQWWLRWTFCTCTEPPFRKRWKHNQRHSDEAPRITAGCQIHAGWNRFMDRIGLILGIIVPRISKGVCGFDIFNCILSVCFASIPGEADTHVCWWSEIQREKLTCFLKEEILNQLKLYRAAEEKGHVTNGKVNDEKAPLVKHRRSKKIDKGNFQQIKISGCEAVRPILNRRTLKKWSVNAWRGRWSWKLAGGWHCPHNKAENWRKKFSLEGSVRSVLVYIGGCLISWWLNVFMGGEATSSSTAPSLKPDGWRHCRIYLQFRTSAKHGLSAADGFITCTC